MIDIVKTIISKDIEEIIGSSMSLQLLHCYSELFLNGAQPRTCAKSQREYYRKLVTDGLEKAKIMAEKNESTHKYNKKGLKYVGQPFCRHYKLQQMTDEEAIELLKAGFIKEEDFKVLPKGFESGADKKIKDLEAQEKADKAEVKRLVGEYKDKTFDGPEIGKLKKLELVAYATVKEYPVKDWENSNAKDLAKYLKGKIVPNENK